MRFLSLILILEIVLVFGALMFIHELGHFLFAKKAGILVREFSLGLGPKLFSFKKGETQYSLRILPFGAFVRMAGEDPEIADLKTGQKIGIKLNQKGRVTDIYLEKGNYDNKIKVDNFDLEHDLFIEGTTENDIEVKYKLTRDALIHTDKKKKMQIAPWNRQFSSKSIKDRFATIIAGPVFNIFLAILLFISIGVFFGVPGSSVIVTDIQEGTPADYADFQVGDELLGIDDITYESYNELLYEIRTSPEEELNLRIERDGQISYIPVAPEKMEDGSGRIGINTEHTWKDIPTTQAIKNGFNNSIEYTVLIFEGFGQLIAGKVGMDDVAGPVGIMTITGQAAQMGIPYLMNWAGILSLYLGIFNLLPVPALDGSRLMFLSLEAVRGKPVDPKKESMVHFIGFALLMLLMVVVTINDISRIPEYLNK